MIALLGLVYLAVLPVGVLMARTRRVGMVVGGVLTAVVMVELLCLWHVALASVRITLLLLLPLVAVAVVVIGGRIGPKRESPASQPMRIGRLVCAGYCVAVSVISLLLVALTGVDGYPVSPPPVSAIGHLPSDLVIAGDTWDCGGSANHCVRYVVLRSRNGADPATAAAGIADQFKARGWHDIGSDGRWESDQVVGRLLDERHETVDMWVEGETVHVSLEEWDTAH